MAYRIQRNVVATAVLLCLLTYLSVPRLLRGQGQTEADARLSRWRPTRELANVGYVGNAVCAKCHASEAANFFATPMANALKASSDCELLARRPRMTFREGPYLYRIDRQGARATYTVSEGANSISTPILYCFGQGVAGQTYVFQREGSLYESRVSYFQELQGLNITILHPRSVPTSLESALGRRISAEGADGCFNCHSTGALRGGQLRLDQLTPGVGCEACHGPGQRHLAAVKAKQRDNLQIFDPRNLDSLDLTQEFCGACHMSFEQAMLMPDRGGINNLRFQPYRIFSSRGHLQNDPRVKCTACHDPHDKLKHEASFYDPKCLACHVSDKQARTETRSAPSCPIARARCVECHMPKVEVPEMHFQFTDHWIRIVKTNEAVPR